MVTPLIKETCSLAVLLWNIQCRLQVLMIGFQNKLNFLSMLLQNVASIHATFNNIFSVLLYTSTQLLQWLIISDTNINICISVI